MTRKNTPATREWRDSLELGVRSNEFVAKITYYFPSRALRHTVLHTRTQNVCMCLRMSPCLILKRDYVKLR